MSTARTSPARVVVPALLALGALVVPALAQDDLLELTRRKNEVEAQKLEAEVQKGLEQARALARSQPDQARGVLLTYKHIVENDTVLTAERRATLLGAVNGLLSQVEQARRASPAPAQPLRPAKTYEDQVRAQYQANRPAVPADDPSQVAKRFYQEKAGVLEVNRRLENQQANGFRAVLQDIDSSAIPTDGYVSFPKHWQALVDRRPRGPKLTKEEADLLKMLNSVMTVDFDRATFKDVIAYLQERTGQPIVLDGNAMKEVGVEYDTPVSFRASKVTVKTILRKVLGDVGLAYILRDGAVQIVTPQTARETMVTRSYPISDLMPPPDPRFGPFYNRYQNLYFASQVINMIQTTVDPSSWAANGGRATIFYHEPSNSIVVRQSAEMHLSLANSFGP